MNLDKFEKVLLSCLLYVLFAANIFGQYQNIRFDHYTPNDGLSNGFVNSIVQDNKGFIWIGTSYGLNRFDGISFKKYLFDSKDATSISDNLINALTNDSLGNLWIMTNQNLCIYDRKKDNFSRKTLRVNNIRYNNLSFLSGFIDNKGYLWLGSWGAIYRIRVYNNPQISNGIIDAERYVLDEYDTDQAYRSNVYSFIQDENGKVWAVSFSNKLYYFDDQKHKFIPQRIDLPDTKKFSNKQKFMIKDHDGDFIITIEGNGLLVWNRNKNKFDLYKPNGTNTGPNDNVLYSLLEDKDGLIWIGSRNLGGINIFNKKTGKFSYIVSDAFNFNSLNANSLNCFYQDKSGNIWVGLGTGKGVDKYSPGKQKFDQYYSNASKPNGLNTNNILCFAERKTGSIAIGTDGGGLNILDRSTGKFSHYINIPSNPNSLSSNAIISICEDHEGTLWMGTFNGGLTSMKGNSFKAYLPNPSDPYSLSYRHVWYVMEDSKKNLWVGTLNHGLDLFDRKTNRFYHYVSKDDDSTSLSNNGILSIYEDSRQTLYITTYSGVNVIDLNSYDFSKMPPDIKFRRLLHVENKNSLSSNGINCVKEDNVGNVWFGTMSTGIDMLNRQTGQFINYATKDGLPGNAVTSILVDDRNNLWLATDKGLAEFNPRTKQVRVFDRSDGLLNTNFRGWALKTTDGEMFFGGPDGFNSFYPEQIKSNQNKPSVLITGLKVSNKPVEINEKVNGRVILSEDISETKELVFTYQEDFITFNFVALEYTLPEKNQYAYMMQGFDKDWVQCGHKHEANYTNLNPGKYIFRVKASNNDGIWNEQGTSIEIIILPPWWKTIWFRMMFITFLTFLVVMFFYLRIAAYKSRQKELTQLVHLRTEELEQKNMQLLQEQIRIEEQKASLEGYAEEVNMHNEELKNINEKLLEHQTRIEEQSEELRAHSENLREANDLLLERQKLIQLQAKKLEESNHELSVLNSTKDRFFSIIAHDLRNPFHAVTGFSEILLRDYKKLPVEKTERFLSLIYRSSVNGNELLENLLQWSRAQTGRISFEPVQLLLFDVAENVLSLLEIEAQRKSILVTQAIEPGTIVFADENMLQTILRNLISNAIKFTKENGVITISAYENTSMAEISVADTGVGIPPENVKLLFDVGTNISTRGTASESGTGLGLILCKEFVERNGGKISVESEPGKGSRFNFTLPRS
jgi:signal transduction histidine kinase/ligand-binding sensor domain-containing protein